MNTQMTIAIIVAIILIVIAAYLWYRGQKKVVLQALGFLVHKAEAYFSAGENQTKINFVLGKIKSFIPFYLLWLWNEDWIKKQVKIVLLAVEKELGYTSTMEDVADKARREVLTYAENYARKSITAATDYMTNKLINADVDGNRNLVSNEQIKLINEDIKEKIGHGVSLKAFVTGETNLKGNSIVTGGLSFEKKL